MKKVPVLFIVFNRLSTASRVFEAIRTYKPERLYMAADGPRSGHPEDVEKCASVRNLASQVDWSCEVVTLFRERNLDCRKAISSAVTWFFEQEPEGIVLEDDCLPGQDFFHYCSILLDYYREDKRIMHIGGVNLQQGRLRGSGSYYFSNVPSIWGWASWRRSWRLYDINMTLFPEFEYNGQMIDVFPDERVAAWATRMARLIYEQKINTYDFQWAFSMIVQHGLALSPNANLVSNIGFIADARHTTDPKDVHANIPIGSMKELVHPQFMVADNDADIFQLSLSIPKENTGAAAPSRHFHIDSLKRLLHVARF